MTKEIKLPPLPENSPNVMRRIRLCEGEVAAQIVLEYALKEYATQAVEAYKAQQQGEAVYQYQLHDGSWIDQSEDSYKHNLQSGCTTLRALYTHPAPAQQQGEAVAMNPMTFDDGRKGWYVHTPEFYCDIEPNEAGQWSVFFREPSGAEGYAEQSAPQPAQQPLTDEDILELAEPFGAFQFGDAQGDKRIAFARALEAAHNIKGE